MSILERTIDVAEYGQGIDVSCLPEGTTSPGTPHKEIEQKYFVHPALVEELITGVTPVHIEQRYLYVGTDGNVRVRRCETVKKGKQFRWYEYTTKRIDPEDGLPWETDYPISWDIFNEYAVFSQAHGFLPVHKTRFPTQYKVPLKGRKVSVPCHIDVYDGYQTNLTVVELEFRTKKQRKAVDKALPPGLFVPVHPDLRQGVRNKEMALFGLPFWAYQ